MWVAPNNLNWSRVKLQVVSSGRQSETRLGDGFSLRAAPQTVVDRISNIPAGPPDRTPLWPAVSDSEPHSVIDLHSGDTIVVQALEAEHIPRWEGELSEAREAFFDVIEAQLSTAHLRALGPNLGEYQWPDYRRTNETVVTSPRNRAVPPGTLEGAAIDPTTGIAYVTTLVPAGTNGYLATVDLTTGGFTRVGNVDNYNIHSVTNNQTRIEVYGLAIDEEGEAFVTFFSDDSSAPGVDSEVARTEVWKLNLKTGALISAVSRITLTSGLQTWRSIAVDDTNVYVTRTNDTHDMFAIPKAGGSAVKQNTGTLTDGSTIESIAYSPLYGELVALTADHRIRVWDDATKQFKAVTAASGGGIESDTNKPYIIFFDDPGTLIQQLQSIVPEFVHYADEAAATAAGNVAGRFKYWS